MRSPSPSPPASGSNLNLNSNISDWMTETCPPYSIITSNCGNIKLGLLGFISDEKSMFRDNTFRGCLIDNVVTSFEKYSEELLDNTGLGMGVNAVIPMTHQSVTRDRELASAMSISSISSISSHSTGVIIGGHEHEKCHEVTKDNIHIVKTGCDAVRCSVIDLNFDEVTKSLIDVNVNFVNLEQYNECPIVKAISSKHASVLQKISHETIISPFMLPPSSSPEHIKLSSERTRFQQTTIGAMLAHAIKTELSVDAGIINGASIKGGEIYEDNKVSYDELKKELPFPTKIVVVPMKLSVLKEAIRYSRTEFEDGGSKNNNDSEVEVARRGYLQVDFDFMANHMNEWTSGSKDDSHIILVALPRNLLSGFCKIKPLMNHRAYLESLRQIPEVDDFIPALDLVVRYCCKHRWSSLSDRNITFSDIDVNNDGYISRDELKRMMEDVLGDKVSEFAIDDMFGVMDGDGDGRIEVEEFEQVMADMKRRSGDGDDDESERAVKDDKHVRLIEALKKFRKSGDFWGEWELEKDSVYK